VSTSRPDAARPLEGQQGAASPPSTHLRRPRRDWPDTLLRPHVLLAVLTLAAAVPYLLASFGGQAVDVVLPPLGDGAGEAVREVEMPLVIVGVDGVVRSSMATVASADHETARLSATLAALRDQLVDDGIWPSEVAAPAAASFVSDRRRVVVVDVPVQGAVSTSVAAEWAALRSMVETMRAAGADDVRVIVDGGPAAILWGHVALP
jgi:hypothetical protein